MKKKTTVCLFTITIILLGILYINKNKVFWGNYDVSFEGVRSVKDNPWRTNAGIIRDKGEWLFLTPETTATLSNFKENENIIVQYRIHPQVAEFSDGAGILVQLLDDKNNVIKQESHSILPTSRWASLTYPLDENPNIKKIKITCNSGKNGNSDADWVVFRQKKKLISSSFGKNGYIKSATYYANEWPINFWNSELNTLNEDLKKIREDGFDSIILIIPWREFQPHISPVNYNDYALRKLDTVMKAATANGLDVYTRVGYTWDFYNDDKDDINSRFINLFNDKITQDAWEDYAKHLNKVLKQYECFKGAFLVWEDYRGVFRICSAVLEKRLHYAKKIGYQAWVKKKYSLQEFNRTYGSHYDSLDSIPIPSFDDPAMRAFYEFNDIFLNSLLAETQKVFPNISMEVRMDMDLVKNLNGNKDYYRHDKTYLCESADFVATMYGIPMGFENNGEKVAAKEAVRYTEYILENLQSKTGDKPVYVEQFIFVDNTPAFSRNAQVKPEEVGEYLFEVRDVLKDYTAEYGIWTYRDYRNNLLYNPGFDLDFRGWDILGAPKCLMFSGSKACHLVSGDCLRQYVSSFRLQHFPSDTYYVSFDIVKCNLPGKITVNLGKIQKKVSINCQGPITLEFNKSDHMDLSVKVLEGDFLLDNICLHSFVQKGQLYDEFGNELEYIQDIRKLNSRL